MATEFKVSGCHDDITYRNQIKLTKVKNCLKEISIEDCKTKIIINEDNYYTIRILGEFISKCPFNNVKVALVRVSDDKTKKRGDKNNYHKRYDNHSGEVLSEATISGCKPGILEYEGVLSQNTKLYIRLNKPFEAGCLKLDGHINTNPDKLKALDLLKRTTDHDLALKVKWIPLRPPQPRFPTPTLPPQYPTDESTYAWFANIIPDRIDQLPYPLVPDSDAYKKFQSVQYSVFFYLGLDMFNEKLRKSPNMTLFIKNLEDRGFDNLLKKKYMFSMLGKLLPYYTQRINDFLNELVSVIDIYNRGEDVETDPDLPSPTLSSFKTSLINFFLRIHIGDDPEGFPDYVFKYFETFVDIIGFGDPLAPGRDEAMLFGYNTVGAVKEYFNRRANAIRDNKDKSTLLYWWVVSGLSPQSLVIESVHNIVAFSQFENTFYRLVADAVWAQNPGAFPQESVPFWYPVPPVPIVPQLGIAPIDFFNKMFLVQNDPVERLNVVREAFRILAPNTNSFSKTEPFHGVSDLQGRHVHQLLMILNEQPQPPTADNQPLRTANYFKYSPERYVDFNTSLQEYGPTDPIEFMDLTNVTTGINPQNFFVNSPIDNQTVLDIGNTKLLPVFEQPTYAPFGLGYRRCAGEALVYQFTEMLIMKFISLDDNGVPIYKRFYFKPLEHRPPVEEYVTLGPFTAVTDNLYFRQTY